MNSAEIVLPSNKKFGFFFSFVFTMAFLYMYLFSSSLIWCVIFGVLSAIMLVTTLVSPDKLKFLNTLWFKFGLLLGMIISPIVLGIIFFILISPIALVIKLAGRDELRLKMIQRNSHWKAREPIGPEPQSFKNQF